MDINSGGIGNVQYPLIADLDKSISRSYDVLMGTTEVTVFDEDNEIKEELSSLNETEETQDSNSEETQDSNSEEEHSQS